MCTEVEGGWLRMQAHDSMLLLLNEGAWMLNY